MAVCRGDLAGRPKSVKSRSGPTGRPMPVSGRSPSSSSRTSTLLRPSVLRGLGRRCLSLVMAATRAKRAKHGGRAPAIRVAKPAPAPVRRQGDVRTPIDIEQLRANAAASTADWHKAVTTRLTYEGHVARCIAFCAIEKIANTSIILDETVRSCFLINGLGASYATTVDSIIASSSGKPLVFDSVVQRILAASRLPGADHSSSKPIIEAFAARESRGSQRFVRIPDADPKKRP